MIRVEVENRGIKSRITGRLSSRAGVKITLTGKDFLPTGEQVASFLKWKSKLPEGILLEREPLISEAAVYEPPDGPEVAHEADKVRLISTLDLNPATEVDIAYLTDRLREHWQSTREGEKFTRKKIKGLRKVETIFKRDAEKKQRQLSRSKPKGIVVDGRLQSP